MITIRKSPTADTRTCDYKNVTEETLYNSSLQHIADVNNALWFFGQILAHAAATHDADKLTDITGFHHDFLTGFEETTWWEKHKELNRHHLSPVDGRIPEDVNLIDVLDYIADCTMAGMARSGEVRTIVISQEVLMRAFWNTAKLLENQVKVEE